MSESMRCTNRTKSVQVLSAGALLVNFIKRYQIGRRTNEWHLKMNHQTRDRLGPYRFNPLNTRSWTCSRRSQDLHEADSEDDGLLKKLKWNTETEEEWVFNLMKSGHGPSWHNGKLERKTARVAPLCHDLASHYQRETRCERLNLD